MRALLAVDGSPSSDRASDLAAGLAWPFGSTIHVLSAYQMMPTLMGMPGSYPPPGILTETEAALRSDAETLVCATVARLDRPGLSAAGEACLAHAAPAIIDGAERLGADLIVIGSRGLGPFEGALLGSTSAAVADQASCPVLVARGAHVRRILFADDGSESALAAGEVLRGWPIFGGCPVRVVSVSEVHPHWHQRLRPFAGELTDAVAAAVARTRDEHAAVAEATATRLRDAGIQADSIVLEGNPAHQIVAATVNWGADLVVLGTRRQTGLAKLRVGSVVRNVLMHAPCSVLIVRRA